MADLNHEQKTAIVVLLAKFKTPAQVRDLMRVEYGLELDIRQIVTYDPTRSAFEAGQTYHQLFEQTREAYVSNVTAIPIANQGFRLNLLMEMVQAASVAGNRGQAAALLKQAAEEVGGAYTNERNVRVEKTNGGFKDLTPEERRMAVSEMIREQLGKDMAQTAPSTGVTQ
jgi:hypothetical protein